MKRTLSYITLVALCTMLATGCRSRSANRPPSVTAASPVQPTIIVNAAQAPAVPVASASEASATALMPPAAPAVVTVKDYGIVVQPADQAIRIERLETGDLSIAYEPPVRIQADADGGLFSVDLFQLQRFREQPIMSTMVAAGYGVLAYQGYRLLTESDDDDSPSQPTAPQTVNGDYYYIAGRDNISFVQTINTGEGEGLSASSASQGGAQ